MHNVIEQELYSVGDKVSIKSFFNDEPDDIGVVKEVDTTYGHGYYYVEYIDKSGRHMICGCANKHIRGRLPRIEKCINETSVLFLEDYIQKD